MIKILIPFLTLLITSDYLIYIVFLRGKRRQVTLLYFTATVLIYIAFTIVLLSQFKMMQNIDTMPNVLWYIFTFLCILVPKFAATIVLAIGLLVRKFSRYKGWKWLRISAIGVALLTLCTMIYGATCGRKNLRIEQVEIYSEKLPRSFDGYRIALFSDLHLGNYGGWSGIIQQVVDKINELDVDIAVQAGDLVNIHSGELTPDLMKLLGSIKPPTYSVLGNHDLAYYIRDTVAVNPTKSRKELREKQAQMGWTLLINQSEWIKRGKDSILIGGTSFPSHHPHNGIRSNVGISDLPSIMKDAKNSDFAIVISHTPSLFDSTYTHIPMPDLILSGHTHAMQNKIKIGKWQWSPAKMLYPQYSGLYTRENRHLYVNDGMGYVAIPMRVGAKPELTIITLRSTQNNE